MIAARGGCGSDRRRVINVAALRERRAAHSGSLKPGKGGALRSSGAGPTRSALPHGNAPFEKARPTRAENAVILPVN